MRRTAMAAGVVLACVAGTARAEVMTLTCGGDDHILIDTGSPQRMLLWTPKRQTPAALTQVKLTSEFYEGTLNTASPATLHVDRLTGMLSLHLPDGSIQGPWGCKKDATPQTPPSGAPAPSAPPAQNRF